MAARAHDKIQPIDNCLPEASRRAIIFHRSW
jgi:hypothetical protein